MPLFTFLFWFFQDSAGLGFNHQKMCVCMYVYAAYRYSESMSREAIQKGDQNHVSSRMSDSRIPSNVDAVSQADSVAEPLNMNMEEHIEIVEPLKLPDLSIDCIFMSNSSFESHSVNFLTGILTTVR